MEAPTSGVSEHLITLKRGTGGFGFRIIGGQEEKTQVGQYLSRIYIYIYIYPVANIQVIDLFTPKYSFYELCINFSTESNSNSNYCASLP